MLGTILPLLLALAGPPAAAGWSGVPAAALRGGEGLAAVDGPAGASAGFSVVASRALLVDLPGAQELEFEYEVAGGPMQLTWCAANDGAFDAFGWYWRHQVLRPGRGRVRVDLRSTSRYRPDSAPMLYFRGNGRVSLLDLRALGPAPTAAAGWAAIDAARRQAPEAVSHALVNSLAPSLWSVSRGAWVQPWLGAAFLGLASALAIGAWARRRRWRPGGPLLAATLAAVAASDLHAACKLAPTLRLAPDPDERVRLGYPLAPEAGALAALARAAIPPDADVLVLGGGTDWYGPAVICFQLAPRRCAIARGEGAVAGLSGVDPLESLRVGALVSIDAGGAAPPGFSEVARTSPRGFVALRP